MVDINKKINEDLKELVSIGDKIGASDIHITSGRYVTFRIKGRLQVFRQGKIFSTTDILHIYQDLDLNMNLLETNKAVDAGLTIDKNRLRIHFYKALDGYSISIRLISLEIPEFNNLFLPDVLKSFIKKRTGLVIVTGATGSGKSTTLASLINEINKNESKKIITVEDPIEYVYKDNQSLIVQREVGPDVNSFNEAISQAMREDPDILLVGELRDLATIEAAIRMAETGHLVFGTLHTRGAAETFTRIIDVFPGNEQDQIRTQLSQVVQGVVSQQLITTKDDRRLPLIEVLVMNTGARGIVANASGNLSSLKDNISQNHSKLNSQSFVQSAADLIKNRRITLDDVRDVFDEDDIKKIRSYISGIN